MTNNQYDNLTNQVSTTLMEYIDIVTNHTLCEEKIYLLSALFEYMLTPEVKTTIFMQSKFRGFTKLILKKIQNFRSNVLAQENQLLMKSMDELELYIHDLAIARGGRGVKRCRKTGPHTGLMTHRSETECQSAICSLAIYNNKNKSNSDSNSDSNGDIDRVHYRRRSARLINKKEKQWIDGREVVERHKGSINIIV